MSAFTLSHLHYDKTSLSSSYSFKKNEIILLLFNSSDTDYIIPILKYIVEKCPIINNNFVQYKVLQRSSIKSRKIKKAISLVDNSLLNILFFCNSSGITDASLYIDQTTESFTKTNIIMALHEFSIESNCI